MLWRVKAKPRRALPASFVDPCVASEGTKAPAGPGWIHEIKHDGYRLQVRKNGDRVRLFTRRGYDWTARYPRVADAAAKLKAGTTTIDGELVCVDGKGVADFARLHSRGFDREAFLFAFDVMELDGVDLKPLLLSERKAILTKLLRRAPAGIHRIDHDVGDGQALYEAACRMGLEGIVSKKLTSPYRPGPKRSLSWVKVKNKRAPGYLRVRDGLDG